MTCQDIRDRLSPFLDDELDPVASREILRHVDSCPDCAAALAQLKAVSKSLDRDLDYHRAPDLLRARVLRDTRAAVRPDGGTASSVAARPWRWFSAAAAVIVVAGGTWLVASMPRDDANNATMREAVAGHIRSLMANHLTDVASTDQHTVKPWFSGKLDFSPPVADFSAAGYPLVGGRLDYLNSHTVAALVYQHRKHVINVFVWPAADAHDAIAPAVTQQGFHVIRGTHADMAYCVVSDLNADELATFARLLAVPHRMP